MSNLDNLQQINTNSPRETVVYAADGLVFKRPTKRMSETGWLAKQRHAQLVMQDINRVASSEYFVPQMLEISTTEKFAVEQRAYGHPVSSSYFDKLPPADQDKIYRAMAHFMNDMNQMRPVLQQRHLFDATDDAADLDNIPLKDVLIKLKKHIPEKELSVVKSAKKWFDVASESDASMVFSHGDMNENNIFYDPTRGVVSFIDFADARYENADYMFERDFAKLGWLDLDRIRAEYMALPRTQPVIIKSDPHVSDMRNALQSFKWGAIEFLKRPQLATAVRIKMLREDIAKIKKYHDRALAAEKFARGTQAINAAGKFAEKNSPVPSRDRQK
ncbi:MAG: aminoglycoside phosphotransferase family protein [Alphaproteobacteria bacterium]|nr:aminoglycoside phosphotransferase family protein [Alphaproteobacteria bacterium]